ncbi:gamma-glutamyl-gamma-aminobutyrate hydrolase family protein [Lactobacillus alvi]|uniref:Gamma-glutamyl-gamma-aminobutyrate hydrolase family protein n=1 Tax=Limosilactobacillus alvi TaxID=990412 RepID=A0ABS2EMT0_9LACO|nr:gamma-glutamyl-gamma-aminobutyrate hydrolase family protein [Limosilactobacillus alvi]MBM6753794.1 gamma-glutamyl-gamma-aminobutyrate hydrolase family protein [Limosilactobacillus alvi]
MHPKIAVPADTLTEATNIINERMAPFAPKPIIEAIVKSGGVPVILPSVNPKFVPDYLDLFDGVIFAGGADVDPTFYDEEPHQKLGVTYRKRDLFEIELLKEALKAGKAVFGICRGLQVINVALGGTLYQDLSENPATVLKHSQDAPGNFPSHHITVSRGTRLHNLMGDRPYVNSRHHQIIKEVAPSLRAVARADDDVVEALESTTNDQILAVQWHPENMFKHYPESQHLFTDLIQRAQSQN